MAKADFLAEGDSSESGKSARFIQSMRLLQSIVSDLDPLNFTFQEVQDALNFSSDDVDTRPCWKPHHLNALEEQGYIARNEDGRSYRVVKEPGDDSRRLRIGFTFDKDHDDDLDDLPECS